MSNFFSANPPEMTETLKNKSVFVAGAGGLGSNVSVMLARAGIGHIVVIDFDKVEPSNINRQYYFRDQVGMTKVQALKENLLRINPELKVDAIEQRLTMENCGELIPETPDLVFECFDCAAAKAMLTSFALGERPTVPVVAVSGLAGIGPCEDIKISKGPGQLYIVGDGICEMSAETGTVASRVMQVSAMQAHVGVRLLLNMSAQ